MVPRLAPGSTFADRFKILAYVGQGRRGSVYRAEPLAGGEPVALEIVSLGADEDPQAFRGSARDIVSGSLGESPHVAPTLDSGSVAEAGLAWVATKLTAGEGPAAEAATRPSVVVRPGAFITLVIVSVVVAGFIIYWLLRSMRI
jgi:serine/threonine protein kinase